MKKIKYICVLLLCLGLFGCNSTEINIEESELVGIWLSRDFDETVRNHEEGTVIYITYDGNLFIHLTSETSNGAMTSTLHFSYEVIDNQLKLEPLSERRDMDMNRVQISILSNDKIQLDMREAVSWIPVIYLYHVSNYVPYGWTDVDRQEIIENNEWVRNEIIAFAQYFSQVIGSPVLLYDGSSSISDARFIYRQIIVFDIDDNLIEIAFAGPHFLPPAPISRHVFEGSPLIEWFMEVRNASGQFILIYNDWQELPQEWIDIFASLYWDLIEQ